VSERQGWLIALEDQAGRVGWGEATPFAALGCEAPALAFSWLQGQLDRLSGQRVADALHELPAASQAPPAARCGLEMALLDLLAKQSCLPLANYLHSQAASSVRVQANLGALCEVAPSAIAQCAEAGYRCVKLKVALAPVAAELARLREIAACLPPAMQLRLDANEGWTAVEASRFVNGLEGLPVKLLEDPLHCSEREALARLSRISPTPLGLDQSFDPLQLAQLFSTHNPQTLVLKPMRCGGLLPCLDIARQARRAHWSVLVTTSLDGAIASHATVHLAAAIDNEQTQPHGLATSSWLAADIGPAPHIAEARIRLGSSPGLGCDPFPLAGLQGN
jgi:o-succinylbenzoate synthase